MCIIYVKKGFCSHLKNKKRINTVFNLMDQNKIQVEDLDDIVIKVHKSFGECQALLRAKPCTCTYTCTCKSQTIGIYVHVWVANHCLCTAMSVWRAIATMLFLLNVCLTVRLNT